MKLHINKLPLLVLSLLCLGSLSACKPESQTDSAEPSEVAEQEGPTLATVNGEAITQADVEFMISRTFSSAEQLFFDEKMQSKVLDSLIASKAMQQSMRESLSSEQLAEIDSKARAYKEELFVKEYLVQNATPEPVSTKMVNDYYNQYPEEFGGGESRLFEMLTTNAKPDETQRDKILASASALKENKAWKAFAQDSSLALSYRQATMQPGLLAPALERTVKSLKLGETSDIIFIKEVPHQIRLLKIEPLPAKPLAEVSATIRKKLAALQLKKAVKAASEQAISNADVVRSPQ